MGPGLLMSSSSAAKGYEQIVQRPVCVQFLTLDASLDRPPGDGVHLNAWGLWLSDPRTSDYHAYSVGRTAVRFIRGPDHFPRFYALYFVYTRPEMRA